MCRDNHRRPGAAMAWSRQPLLRYKNSRKKCERTPRVGCGAASTTKVPAAIDAHHRLSELRYDLHDSRPTPTYHAHEALHPGQLWPYATPRARAAGMRALLALRAK